MRVLLVDDHPLFLDGLQNLLTGRGIQVVGTARDGFEALEKARSLHPEVILMDIQMPRCDGLAATRLIKAELPEIKIVMLTMSSEDDDLFAAIKSGACGYLLKTQDTEEFFSRLIELAQGEAPLSAGLALKLLNEYSRVAKDDTGMRGGGDTERQSSDAEHMLSIREREVLALISQGLTYKEAGVRLHLTERTIKYHMGEIIARLQMENRAQVIEFARRSGLV
jgi:two-component system NarL family response regulator